MPWEAVGREWGKGEGWGCGADTGADTGADDRGQPAVGNLAQGGPGGEAGRLSATGRDHVRGGRASADQDGTRGLVSSRSGTGNAAPPVPARLRW